MPMNRYLRPHKQAKTHRHLLKNVLFHIPSFLASGKWRREMYRGFRQSCCLQLPMESIGPSVTPIKFYHTKQLQDSIDYNHREKLILTLYCMGTVFVVPHSSQTEVTVQIFPLIYKSKEQIILQPSEYNSGFAFELGEQPVLTTDY